MKNLLKTKHHGNSSYLYVNDGFGNGYGNGGGEAL